MTDGEFRAAAYDEVVHDEQWVHRRPPKTARMADHLRMMVMKNPAMALVVGSSSPSPSAYPSPPGRYQATVVSPVVESPQSLAVDPWRSEEKENLMPHSLSGRFPSVSTFKQYQNAAMAYVQLWMSLSLRGGRFSDGWGSCERREKRFLKPNHDIPSTAETRAKNKACQDLLGIGEYRPGVKL